jgi:hypothetical protein
MRLFTRSIIAAVGIALALGGCGHSRNASFSVTHPNPATLTMYKEQAVVEYAFSSERRALLKEAYDKTVWKPINLMLNGKIPYEIIGEPASDENGHTILDYENADYLRLPVTPNSWVYISSTLQDGESRDGVTSAYAKVKLAHGVVDRATVPDYFSICFVGDECIWLNSSAMHFGNDNVLVPDTWASLARNSFDANDDVDVRQRSGMDGEILSSRPFKGLESKFHVLVGRNFSPTVEDVKRADARFIQSLSRVQNMNGSDLR